jgi:hypothetical protein
MVRLPDDLRRELESALGHPVPEALSQEEIKALGKEVSAKAPGLFRAVADLVGNEVRQAAKRKPESRAARPSGLTRYLYVQDKDGNWVPSRERYIALFALVALGFLGFAYVMITPSSKPKSVTQAPTTAASVPAPPPSVQAAEEQEEAGSTAGSEDEASAAGQAQGQGAGSGTGAVPPPPSPLPGPNPNLPPPPDYVPTQEGQAQMEGLTVVYSRNSGGGGAGEGQGGAVQGAAFYARPKAEGEAGLVLTPTRPPSQTQGQEGEGEGKVAGSFWARSKEDGSGLFSAPTSALAQGEGKEASGGLEVQALRGKSASEGGESAGLQVHTPRAGSPQAETGGGEAGGARGKGLEVSAPAKPGEVQVVWRRSQGEVRGGIVPPGGQGISTPGVGSGSKAPSSAPSESGGEGSAVPPPSPGGSP